MDITNFVDNILLNFADAPDGECIILKNDFFVSINTVKTMNQTNCKDKEDPTKTWGNFERFTKVCWTEIYKDNIDELIDGGAANLYLGACRRLFKEYENVDAPMKRTNNNIIAAARRSWGGNLYRSEDESLNTFVKSDDQKCSITMCYYSDSEEKFKCFEEKLIDGCEGAIGKNYLATNKTCITRLITEYSAEDSIKTVDNIKKTLEIGKKWWQWK
jgi:hypothetical protein